MGRPLPRQLQLALVAVKSLAQAAQLRLHEPDAIPIPSQVKPQLWLAGGFLKDRFQEFVGLSVARQRRAEVALVESYVAQAHGGLCDLGGLAGKFQSPVVASRRRGYIPQIILVYIAL